MGTAALLYCLLVVLVFVIGMAATLVAERRERATEARRESMDVCDTPRLKALRQKYMDDPNYTAEQFEADVEAELRYAAAGRPDRFQHLRDQWSKQHSGPTTGWEHFDGVGPVPVDDSPFPRPMTDTVRT